jgi:hypothetical protein
MSGSGENAEDPQGLVDKKPAFFRAVTIGAPVQKIRRLLDAAMKPLLGLRCQPTCSSR